MSIVIRTEELNYLIYRYFQEQGLSHSAFALSNEGQLEQVGRRLHDEVRPGQLVNLIEKALVFCQLQEHVAMNEYFECKVATQLIGRHVCEFSERRQQVKVQESRERELIVANALNRSQEFSVSRNGQTMDWTMSEEQLLKASEVVIENEEIVHAQWNQQRGVLGIAVGNCLKYLNMAFETQHIFPTCIGESFHRVKLMRWDQAHGNYMLLVFENGVALVTDMNCQLIKMFNIKNVNRIKTVVWNHNWPNIATIVFEKDMEIIDVFKCQTIRVIENVLHFDWRYYDQFIVMDQDFFINLYQVDQDKPLLQLKAELETSLIEFNQSKTLLASFSSLLNNIKVWTLLNEQYVFEITDDSKILNFCWCSSQNANYLITLTLTQLNIWDVEFGQMKCSYSIEDKISSLVSLDMLGESPQVALTTADNKIIVYDLINRKRRVIQLSKLPHKIIKINEDQVLLIFTHMLTLINIKKLDSLLNNNNNNNIN